jgi:hypothetical protein
MFRKKFMYVMYIQMNIVFENKVTNSSVYDMQSFSLVLTQNDSRKIYPD